MASPDPADPIAALTAALTKLLPNQPSISLMTPSFDWNTMEQYDDFQLFHKSVESWFTLQKRKYDSATSCLQKLHWLPIHHRIEFKIISLVHKCLHNNAPPYLQRLIQHTRPTRKGLRSEEDTTRLLVPRTSRKTFASRSFSVLGPQLWNDLPRNLHRIDNYTSFKKELKTHLFKVAFLGHTPSD